MIWHKFKSKQPLIYYNENHHENSRNLSQWKIRSFHSIAQHLIQEIGKENVIAVARTPERAEDLDAALQGVDAVLLVSGMDEPQKRIEQHRNVIASAKKNGVKKIVYTSIIGAEENNAFSPIVQSNRQIEQDVRESDLEYIDTYVKEGEIRNCAGDGKCTYTSRQELGYAYTKMLTEERHNGQTYNLVGTGISQSQLAETINQVFNTNLNFNNVTAAEYLTERKAELGDFIGTVIAGIYQGIQSGANDVLSDFETVTGRTHKSALEMMQEFKAE